MNHTENPPATPPPSPLPPKGRLLLGGGVFVIGLICPIFIPLVTSSGLSLGVKSALSGLLLLGIPEVAMFVAIAILGKEGYAYLKQRLFALLKRAAPIDTVSLTRYRIGLVLFCLPLLTAWLAPYVSDMIPRYGEYHLALAIAGDGLLILGLLVLGGDFWDKVRSLFVHKATATFPTTTTATKN